MASDDTTSDDLERRIAALERTVATDDPTDAPGVGRRGVLGAVAGGGALLGLGASGAAASDHGDGVDGNMADVHYVGAGSAQYTSIQQAHDDLGETGTVVVTSTYDKADSNDPPTIEITKPISLLGTGRTGSTIAADQDAPLVDFALGSGDLLADVAVVRNLTFQGGSDGLVLSGEEYAYVANCTFSWNDGDGLVLRAIEGDGTWGTIVRDCMAYGNGGHGILCMNSAKPHGVVFDGVSSQDNHESGIRIRDGGSASVTISNSVLQHNVGYGLRHDAGIATSIETTYFEGNGWDHPDLPDSELLDAKFDVRLEDMHEVAIDSCYFQGNARNRDSTPKAIQIRNGGTHTIRNCHWNSYSGSIVRILGDATDVNADRSTCGTNGTEDRFWLDQSDGARIRNDGVVVRQDLSAVDGAFDGDRGLDDGSNTAGSGQLCVWNDADGQWVAPDGTAI